MKLNKAVEGPKSTSNKKPLGRMELIALALGGMIGGGIFSILGVAVDIVGAAAPLAILLGGALALFAAYSYIKLAVYYKDEGATYSFFKRTFPQNMFAISAIGWLVSFGYISTLALYAFTFSSYLASALPFENHPWVQTFIAAGILLIFSIINIMSVKGMGKIEDVLVFTKVAILLVISGIFIGTGDLKNLAPALNGDFSIFSMAIVASITFVAFEGFQLVIHAYNETENPDKNVPFAIYGALAATIFIYFILSIGALSSIPEELIIRDKEFALAAGAKNILGRSGQFVIIFGALLATSSAISGTLFGASRLMAVIANDGFLPEFLAKRRLQHIPVYSIIVMSSLAFLLIMSGGLQLILELGSITFIIVSLLMAIANYKIRHKTKTHASVAIISILGLSIGLISLLYYESKTEITNLIFIFCVYLVILFFAFLYGRFNKTTLTIKK